MNAAETLAAMPTEELIDLIRRGLDDDEKTAREAANRRWLVEDNTITLWPDDEHDGYMAWPTRSDAYHAARWEPARVLHEIDSRRRTLVRCEEELLSGIPRLVHFAEQTLRDMARPYLTQETP